MRNSARNAMRGVFGGLVVAGLGFGAGQAFASPHAAPRTAAGTCLKDEASACNASCREELGTGWVGVCTRNQYGQVSCGCRQLIFP